MSPDIGGLTAHFLRAVDPAEMMTHVERVSERDRYQASRGIEEAAALVAEAAQAAGLEDVALARFPADGRTHWWSFRAPRSWTPIRARLEVGGSHPRAVAIDHGRQPFSVATHSAGTPPDGIAARLVVVHDAGGLELVSGAIAIVPRASFTGGALEARLARAGALGFVTDAPCRLDATGREQPGRIELDPDTDLFAFSVTSDQMRLLEGWADEGATARVTIELERTAAMPVVTGTLEGRTGEREVWMTAHLCHPRPSANDNASGVAALIGVAAAHASSRASDRTWGTDRTVRFVWAPEFVGTAAALHSHVRLRGQTAVPSAAINLDMVGEDQSSCGGPFLVERDPGCRPSLITPIADQVVGRVFASTAARPGTWCPVPFVGGSDHAVFVDRWLDCAVVALRHAPDRFNHTAADSTDKVSPTEMTRAAASAAAIAYVAAEGPRVPPSALRGALSSWTATERGRVGRARRRYARVREGAWSRGLADHFSGEVDALRRLAGDRSRAVPRRSRDADGEVAARRLLRGRWAGPINLRALIGDLGPAARAEVAALVAADPDNRSMLTNFAIRADGRRDREDILAETSYTLRRPIDPRVAAVLFDALLESGWVTAEHPVRRAP